MQCVSKPSVNKDRTGQVKYYASNTYIHNSAGSIQTDTINNDTFCSASSPEIFNTRLLSSNDSHRAFLTGATYISYHTDRTPHPCTLWAGYKQLRYITSHTSVPVARTLKFSFSDTSLRSSGYSSLGHFMHEKVAELKKCLSSSCFA